MARCWVLTEGIAGTENQCLGLAEAMGETPLVKRAVPAAPWRFLPPSWLTPPLRTLSEGSDPLEPPWPALLIAGGRKAVAWRLGCGAWPAASRFASRTRGWRPSASTWWSRLAHDGLSGPNVVETRTALHRVTPARLAAAREQFAPSLESLPRPLVAVLVGGASRRHRFELSEGAAVGRALAAMAAEAGAGLAITASRRTPSASMTALTEALADTPARIWRGDGENPYFGYLAAADAIVVTGDSVSMTSEACATGKPVYVAPMRGRGSTRLDRFFRGLAEDRLVHVRRPDRRLGAAPAARRDRPGGGDRAPTVRGVVRVTVRP